MKPLKVNGARINKKIQEMAQIGAFDGGLGVHRLALSAEDAEARKLLSKWFSELGLKTEIDAVGNMFGVPGDLESENPIVIGSHLDTVAYGGRFDGSLGVIGAVEVVQTLKEKGIRTGHPLVIANFTNEEGTRFTPDMMGSMVTSGQLTIEQAWKSIAIDNGHTLKDELDKYGLSGDYQLPSPHAFLEIHIEQGPVLESTQLQIGVVRAVTGIHWEKVSIEGQANHAGTTPLKLRRDAGLAAAEIITYVRDLAQEVDGVITVGSLNIEPGIINIIPRKAQLTLDMRNENADELREAVNRLDYFFKDLENKHRVTIHREKLADVAPVHFNQNLVIAVEKAAASLNLSHMSMVSGAGHDAQLMAGYCPSAMIFIPSRDGISHAREEYSAPEDIESGVNVLLNAVLLADNQHL